MQPVNSFSHDDGARSVAPCCSIISVLEQGLTSKVGDKLPLLQLMLIVTSCCSTGWGTSRSRPVIYLVLPVNYNKHHMNWFNYLQSCSSMTEIWDGGRKKKLIERGSSSGGFSGRELRISRLESPSRKAVRSGVGEAMRFWKMLN